MRDTDEEKWGEKVGDPLSVLTLCQSNTKVIPEGWGQSKGKIRAEGRNSQKEKDSETPSFVCRIVCLLVPFLCHLTLPSSPLLAVSDLSLSSSLLWSCPLLIPHSLPFVWPGIYSRNDHSSFFPPPYSLLGLSSPPSTISASLSLHHSSLSCLLSVTIKMVAVETGLFGNSERKMSTVLCLSILLLPCACGGTRTCEGTHARFSVNVCVCTGRACMCVPPFHSLGLISYMHFTSEELYLYQTCITDIVTMATASEDH